MNRVLRVVIAFGLLAGPAFLSPAAAKPDGKALDCRASIRTGSSFVRLVYDPFDGQQQVADLDIELDRAGDETCDYRIALAGNGSSRERMLLGVGAGSGLVYEARLDGAVTQNDINAPLPLRRGKPANSNRPGAASDLIQVRLYVGTGQFAEAGNYEDRLILRLYETGNGVPRQLGPEVPVLIATAVPSRAQLNFAGTSSGVFGSMTAGSIDFGELRTGAQKEAFVQVRATSPIQLTISSSNEGLLRHKITPSATPGIPYSIAVDSEPILLARGPARVGRKPRGGLKAENYRFVIRIDDADDRIAGTYEDLVTITVEPK